MDATKLKKLTIEKLNKKNLLTDMNEPLVDKLVAEFCAKNPQPGAVLNQFDFSDPEENSRETAESIDYKLSVNDAGLAYRGGEIDEIVRQFEEEVNKSTQS